MSQLIKMFLRKPDHRDKDSMTVQWQTNQQGDRDSQLTLNIEREKPDGTESSASEQSASEQRTDDVTDAVVAEPSVNNNQPSHSSSIMSADRVYQRSAEDEIVVAGTEAVTTATNEVVAQQEANIKVVASSLSSQTGESPASSSQSGISTIASSSSSSQTGLSPASSSQRGISPGCWLLLLLLKVKGHDIYIPPLM